MSTSETGVVFVDDGAVGFEAHSSDAGCVDGARHTFFAGNLEQGAGSLDVGRVHGLRIADPEAVVGGYMHQGSAATDGRAEGFGLEQIADDGFCLEAFEVAEIAGRADKEPQLRTPLGELTGDVRTDESGGSGEKDFHEGGIPKRLFYGRMGT